LIFLSFTYLCRLSSVLIKNVVLLLSELELLFYVDDDKVKPKLQLVHRGAKVMMKCQSYKKAIWLYWNNFTQSFQNLSSNVNVKRVSIFINQVELRHEGTYVCKGALKSKYNPNSRHRVVFFARSTIRISKLV